MYRKTIIFISLLSLVACSAKHTKGTSENTESETNSDSSVQTGTDTGDDGDSQSGSEAESDSSTGADMDSDADADTDSDSSTGADMDSDADTDSDSNDDQDSASENGSDSTIADDTDTSTEPYEPQTCDGEVVFSDPALEQAVRKSINQYIYYERPNTSYTGDITGSLLGDLDTLSYSQGEGITSLQGIECLKNVEWISLIENSISDISLLSSLTNVQTLYLETNRISDIEPLRNLTRLNVLSLSDNPIADLSPLSDLKSIKGLEINNVGVSSLDGISGLTRITYLKASGDDISDISPLSSLSNLMTFDLSDNNITDLSPLSGFASLVIVDLSSNHIVDLNPISGTTFLSLYLSNNDIMDISPLAHISRDDPNNALGELWLDGNQIEDLSVFTELTTPYLQLFDNRIKDLSPLLSAGYSQFYDIYDFSKNQIEDLTPLASFGDISYLDISDNLVSDLTPLAGKYLSTLKAARNAIHDLVPLLGIVGNSGELDLTDNRVTFATPLYAMVRSLENTPSWVSLLGNPLDEVALTLDIPSLCAEESVEVYFGNMETCSWNTEPSITITDYNAAPAPYDGVDETVEVCDAAPLYLLSGALPSVYHSAADFEVDDTIAAEPLVVDLVTGLTWRRCSEGQTFESVDCTADAGELTRDEAVSACAGSFGGFDDWRLATISELLSLIDYSVQYPGPTVDPALFSATYPGGYWSSSSVPDTAGIVGWQVNFYNGTADLAYANDSGKARCVRGTLASPETERLEAGEETVVDTWTGLEWRRCAEGQTFDGARCIGAGTSLTTEETSTACAASFAGYNDWRLPSVQELLSIVNRCDADPASLGAFSDTPRASFWSDTPFPAADPQKWRVDFGFGWSEPGAATDMARVRCVR